jgi:predicted Zn-dependent protease
MKNIFTFIYIVSLVFVSSCSDISPEFQQISSQVLGQAGVNTTHLDKAYNLNKNLSKVKTSLTDEEEYYLGRGVSAMVFSKYKAFSNASLNQYVNKVGLLVAGVSEKPETFSGYHFQVLDSEEVNAFAAPGGFIFVTNGLLKLVPDEDALAGVLAHEVAHVVQGHGVKAIAQANLTQAFLVLGKEVASSYTPGDLRVLTETFGGSITDVFETILGKGYSRSQEYDSDELAVELVKLVGYNPNGLANTLDALSKKKGDGGWFSTHPEPADRLDELGSDSKPDSQMISGQEERVKRFNQAVKVLG